jgi:hypothetical protein
MATAALIATVEANDFISIIFPLEKGVVHTCVYQKVTPINLIVRQNQPLKVKKICTKSTNDLTNTITMVMEPLAPPAALNQ